MKIIKRILVVIIVIIIESAILSMAGEKAVCMNIGFRKPVKVAVLLMNFTDDYINLVRQSLEEVQRENPEKVQFTFYDGKSNQAIQDEELDEVVRKRFDLILLHLIGNRNSDTVEGVINKVKENDTPIIFFNREPITKDLLKSYGKALYIGLDAKEDGIMQGKILIDAWNTNKEIIDKNGDNILQYIMLAGERGNIVAADRTKYSVATINQAGIKTEELSLVYANWARDFAKNAIKSLFFRYGNKIEAIIANDDSMAIGAIEALQEQGYNKGDKGKTIAVVGVEALPEAKELIKNGIMLGTVFQNPRAMADAIYSVGINLVNNQNPLEGTQYKFDETGVSIRIPNTIYE